MDPLIVDQLSKTTAARRDELFRWLARQGEATRLEAFCLKDDLAQQNQGLYHKDHRVEYHYAMFVCALVKMVWIETAQAEKKAVTDEEAKTLTARRIARIKAQHKRKSSPKREVIRVRFYEEIRTLRAEGLSWLQITNYIKTFHKEKFALTYLKKVFEQLEQEKMGIDG